MDITSVYGIKYNHHIQWTNMPISWSTHAMVILSGYSDVIVYRWIYVQDLLCETTLKGFLRDLVQREERIGIQKSVSEHYIPPAIHFIYSGTKTQKLQGGSTLVWINIVELGPVFLAKQKCMNVHFIYIASLIHAFYFTEFWTGYLSSLLRDLVIITI